MPTTTELGLDEVIKGIKPHEVLGVPQVPTVEELKSAYREAIKAFHPDTAQNCSPERMEQLRKATGMLNEAYAKLLPEAQARDASRQQEAMQTALGGATNRPRQPSAGPYSDADEARLQMTWRRNRAWSGALARLQKGGLPTDSMQNKSGRYSTPNTADLAAQGLGESNQALSNQMGQANLYADQVLEILEQAVRQAIRLGNAEAQLLHANEQGAAPHILEDLEQEWTDLARAHETSWQELIKLLNAPQVGTQPPQANDTTPGKPVRFVIVDPRARAGKGTGNSQKPVDLRSSKSRQFL